MSTSGILLIAGLMTTFFGIITLLVTYHNCYKVPRYREEHITAHTTGKVVRRTVAYYNELRLPIVEYQIYDKTYTIRGPKFAASFSSRFTPANTITGPNGSNIPLEGELPILVNASGDHRMAQKDLDARYPIGKEVDVYYDPDDPETAFVERDAPLPKFATSILLAASVTVLLFGAAFLIAALVLK